MLTYFCIGSILWHTTGTDAWAGPARRVTLESDNTVTAVALYPDFQTNLYFPERVLTARVANAQFYDVQIYGDGVGVQPDVRAVPSNLVVETPSLRVTVELGMAARHDDADLVVIYDYPARDELAMSSEAVTTRSWLRRVLEEDRFDEPQSFDWEDGTQRLKLRRGVVSWGKKLGTFRLSVRNDGQYPFPLEDIVVVDRQGHNRVVAVEMKERGDQVEGQIGPGETLHAAIAVSHPAQLRRGLTLQLVPSGGIAPAAWDWEDDKPKPNKGRTAVMATAGGGAMQLERGEGTSAVGMWDVGVVAYHGFSGLWSLEGGFSLQQTGDTDINGTPRSNKLYRVHAAARLHIAAQGWAPYARAGVGAGAASLKDGDKSKTEVALVALASLGVDRWLNENLFLGAVATVEAQTQGSVILAHGYLGFAWGGNDW